MTGKTVLIIGHGFDEAIEQMKRASEAAEKLRKMFLELEPNCFEELAENLKVLRLRSQHEQEKYLLRNDKLIKNHIIQNYRTKIRNQLPRKVRID